MKAFLLSILLVFAFAAHADDMRDYIKVTDNLIDTGQYEEALERTIWFHKHALEHDPNMYGVRLSFALNRWYDFGKKYPPALVALKDMRDTKTNIILAGSGTHGLFHDVFAINRTLSESNKSISLFRYLDKEYPQLAKKCWNIIDDLIIKEKDYALINRYSGSIQSQYSKTERRFKTMVAMHNQNRDSHTDEFIERYKTMFVEETLRLIDLAETMNDKDAVIQIKSQAKVVADEYHIDTGVFQ